MTIIESEQAALNFFAEKLKLELTRTIFRGGIPASKTDAVGVIIEAAGHGNTPSLDTYDLQLLGKYQSRDSALLMLEAIDRATPYWSYELVILKRGNGAIFRSTHAGKDVWAISANFELCTR